MGIPTGYGFVGQRKRETAIKLIASSVAVLDDGGQSIRTVFDGYHVPEDVLDHYEEHKNDEVDEDKTVDPFSLEAPNTNHEAWAESTTIEEERTLEVSTPILEAKALGDGPVAAEQTGAGYDVQPAAAESTDEEPAGNASAAAWLDYAKAQPTWDDADEELGRNELKDKYGSN